MKKKQIIRKQDLLRGASFLFFLWKKNVYKKSSERENNQYETYILYIFGQLFSDGSEAYAIRMNKLLQSTNVRRR